MAVANPWKKRKAGQDVEVRDPGVEKRGKSEGHHADLKQKPPTIDVGQRAGWQLQKHPGQGGNRYDEPNTFRTRPQRFCEQRQHRHPNHVVADKAEHADRAEQCETSRRRHGEGAVDGMASLENE